MKKRPKKSSPTEKRKRESAAKLEQLGFNSHKAKYVLRLYVSGSTLKSALAVKNIKRICEQYLKSRYDLEVIDIYQQPKLARDEQIVAVPTLIKRLPDPMRRLIGDMSDLKKCSWDWTWEHRSHKPAKGGRRLARGRKNRASHRLPALSRRELVARLGEAEEALRAIRSGEVDAIVVNGQGGEKVFTLQGADHTYRVFVERMNEGAAVLSSDHIVLHCNNCFARFVGARLESVIGSSLLDLVWPDDHPKLDALLQRASQKNCRGEIRLQSKRDAPLSVHLSLSPLRLDSARAVCLIASDLSEIKRAEQELRASSEQLRNLAAHLQTIREEERARISREVHDELGQSLTAVKMDLAWLAGRLPKSNGQMLKRIHSTGQLADSIIHSIRRISTELRPGQFWIWVWRPPWNGRSRNSRPDPAFGARSGCLPRKRLPRTVRPPCFVFFRRL